MNEGKGKADEGLLQFVDPFPIPGVGVPEVEGNTRLKYVDQGKSMMLDALRNGLRQVFYIRPKSPEDVAVETGRPMYAVRSGLRELAGAELVTEKGEGYELSPKGNELVGSLPQAWHCEKCDGEAELEIKEESEEKPKKAILVSKIRGNKADMSSVRSNSCEITLTKGRLLIQGLNER